MISALTALTVPAADVAAPDVSLLQLAIVILFFSIFSGALLAREVLRIRTARSRR